MNLRILILFLIFSLISQIAIGGHSRGDWRKQSYYALKNHSNYQPKNLVANKVISFDFNNKSHLLFFVLLSLQVIIPPAHAIMQHQSFPQKNTGDCALDLGEDNALQPAETPNIPTLIGQAVQTAMECFNAPANATCQSQYYHSLPFLRQKVQIDELYEELTFLAKGSFHKVFVAKPRHARLDQNIGTIVVSIEMISGGRKEIPPQLRLQGLLTKIARQLQVLIDSWLKL